MKDSSTSNRLINADNIFEINRLDLATLMKRENPLL